MIIRIQICKTIITLYAQINYSRFGHLLTKQVYDHMTVRTFKLGSGTWEERKLDVLIQPRNYFQYFTDLRKKCIFDHFCTCFTCIFVFYV